MLIFVSVFRCFALLLMSLFMFVGLLSVSYYRNIASFLNALHIMILLFPSAQGSVLSWVSHSAHSLILCYHNLSKQPVLPWLFHALLPRDMEGVVVRRRLWNNSRLMSLTPCNTTSCRITMTTNSMMKSTLVLCYRTTLARTRRKRHSGKRRSKTIPTCRIRRRLAT